MKSLFIAHNILDIVDGTTPRPTTAGDKQKLWDQSSNEALTALYMCMNDEQVEAVSGCLSAQDIWT